jgi:hypothetical protein
VVEMAEVKFLYEDKKKYLGKILKDFNWEVFFYNLIAAFIFSAGISLIFLAFFSLFGLVTVSFVNPFSLYLFLLLFFGCTTGITYFLYDPESEDS